jgi:hypothetical protein
LGGVILRWSDAKLGFHRRDPRVEISNLLLHAVQQRLLLISQLLQLFLDTLALLNVCWGLLVGGLRLRHTRRQQQHGQQKPE